MKPETSWFEMAPEDQMAFVQARIRAGLSLPTTAEEAGISPKELKRYVHRTRQRLGVDLRFAMLHRERARNLDMSIAAAAAIGLCQSEIATHVGCSRARVYLWAQRFGVKLPSNKGKNGGPPRRRKAPVVAAEPASPPPPDEPSGIGLTPEQIRTKLKEMIKADPETAMLVRMKMAAEDMQGRRAPVSTSARRAGE